MSELRVLRRIEFALAAYGAAVGLIVLAIGVDAIHFHLADALASGIRPSLRDAGVIALAVGGVTVVTMATLSAARQIHASVRYLRRLPVIGVRRVGGHAVILIDAAAPTAFCAGLL